MAVMQVVQVQVNPGKMQEFQALFAEGSGITARNGAPAPRVWQAGVAGQNTGTIIIATEFESMAAFGAANDAIVADPEWQALLGKANSIANFSVSLMTEVTGG